jgi:ketosteroid isomerase-like protein
MHPFRAAVEDRDEAAIEALLADDVVFTSPVAFKPYVGKPITAAILRGVLRVSTASAMSARSTTPAAATTRWCSRPVWQASPV